MQISQGVNKFIAGTLTLDGTDQQLPANACRRVWIGAPTSASNGAKTNSAVALIGAKDTGGTIRYPRTLDATNTAGIYLHVNRSDAFYLKGTSGDKVEYMIEQ